MADSGKVPYGNARAKVLLRRFWRWRRALSLALAGLVLLAASQVLWLWHSWPVRDALDEEHIPSGAST